jgi:hypothetical protein
VRKVPQVGHAKVHVGGASVHYPAWLLQRVPKAASKTIPIAPVAYRLSSTPPILYTAYYLYPLTLALKVRLIVKIICITLCNKTVVALKVDEVLILEVERVVKFWCPL